MNWYWYFISYFLTSNITTETYIQLTIPVLQRSSRYTHRDKSVAPHGRQTVYLWFLAACSTMNIKCMFYEKFPSPLLGGNIKNITRQISCTSLLGKYVFSLQQTIYLTSKSSVEYQKMMITSNEIGLGLRIREKSFFSCTGTEAYHF